MVTVRLLFESPSLDPSVMVEKTLVPLVMFVLTEEELLPSTRLSALAEIVTSPLPEFAPPVMVTFDAAALK